MSRFLVISVVVIVAYGILSTAGVIPHFAPFDFVVGLAGKILAG